MKSQVYFIAVKNSQDSSSVQRKLDRLILQSRVFELLAAGQRVVLKMHFGEEGNTGHVKPDYLSVLVRHIQDKKAVAIASDTNTLYRGMRTNSKDHLELAARHGFTKAATGADIVIPEDTAENVKDIAINRRYIKKAHVSRIFLEADVLVNIAHFKGHLMTGFGGALKNIGMGCASRAGKLAQHSDLTPRVQKKVCVGCGACAEVCPTHAISVAKHKAVINGALCVGCASCIAACSYGAMDVYWESGSGNIQKKMVEYAEAVCDHGPAKKIHFNFAVQITKECDCLAKDDPRVAPDIGIFVSEDPVGVDKACYDAVVKECGRDIFKELHPKRNGMVQLEYAAKLGLGHLDYELIQTH